MLEIDAQKETPIVFTGKFAEYFGIWIVNLLLSILSFGVYSAWAKVRRKKYFYNNTLIEGTAFDYHGNPRSILKGRAIAVAFFVAYALTQSSFPLLAQILVLIFVITLPWLVVKGALFKARNASYRGLRFDFVGTVKEAARVFIIMPLLTVFTLGLCTPLASQQKNQFLVDGHRFGRAVFDMRATIKSFYMVYIKLFAKILLVGLVGMFLLGLLVGGIMKGQSLLFEKAMQSSKPALMKPAFMHAPAVYFFANTLPDTPMLAASEATIPPQKTKQQQQVSEIEKMMKNPILLAFKAMRLAASGLVFFMVAAYLQARIGNLVWNNTHLNQLSFKCRMRARDLIWIYLSNIMIIIATFGLATPWAQLRMTRYRTAKLRIIGEIDFDQFMGDKNADVGALGDEVADIFDVDLSFG